MVLCRRMQVGTSGVVNCTEVGMFGHKGVPFPPQRLGQARIQWLMDCVYHLTHLPFDLDLQCTVTTTRTINSEWTLRSRTASQVHAG